MIDQAEAPLGAVTVRRAGVRDGAALLALHRAAFPDGWNMRVWRWRYLENPTGASEVAGAFTTDGRCVASFCGVVLPARIRGEPAVVVRAGDVAVHPHLRSSLAGALLHRRTATAFFTAAGQGGASLVVGFPSTALLRTLVHHQSCRVPADVVAFVHDAAGARTAWRCSVDGTLPPHLGDLIAACSPATGIRRDCSYLAWRYDLNPTADYAWLAVRDPGGRVRAAAVVRDRGLHDDALTVLEWFAAAGDEAADHELFAALRQLARAYGRHAVVCAALEPVTGGRPTGLGPGWRRVPTGHHIVCRIYDHRLDDPWLAREWRHSFGDMDFA